MRRGAVVPGLLACRARHRSPRDVVPCPGWRACRARHHPERWTLGGDPYVRFSWTAGEGDSRVYGLGGSPIKGIQPGAIASRSGAPRAEPRPTAGGPAVTAQSESCTLGT